MKKLLTIIVGVLIISSLLLVCFFAREYLLDNLDEEKAKKSANAEMPNLDKEYLDYYELGEFDTSLPVIYIETEDSIAIEAVQGKVSVLNNANDGSLHNITETPDITLNAGVNYRGASSAHFDKKQYRIKFYKGKSMSNPYNYDLLGMGEANEWVLHGPYLDKTLARNYMVYNLAGEIMEWAPQCEYIELFVNGEYQGVYLVVEPITNGAGRLRLSTFGLLGGDCAYIVARDREESDDEPLNNYGKTAGFTYNNLYVEYPGKAAITQKEYKWIEDDISDFEVSLYGDNYKDPELGYEKYIDSDNFADYFVLNEVVMNHDAGSLSTYAYKELGGKLMMAVWDYNNAYDNYQWFSQDYSEFYLPKTAWFDRLVTDKAFIDKVVTRYRELRQTTLSTQHMYELIDSTTTKLGDAVNRNYKVWGYTFYKNLLSGDDRDITSYEEAISQLKSAIETRFAYLDEHIEDLYQYCN